jgi:hypothetical protein
MRITIYKVSDPKDSSYQEWYGDYNDLQEYLKLYGIEGPYWWNSFKQLNLKIKEVYSKWVDTKNTKEIKYPDGVMFDESQIEVESELYSDPTHLTIEQVREAMEQIEAERNNESTV